MLYSSILVAAATFSGFVAAQNVSLPVGPCCTVNAGSIPASQKSDWCRATQNTCPEICGGQGQIASGGNDCDSTSLKYTCSCKNGTMPDMSKYQQSVPGLMCRYWYDSCINATGSDLAQQYQCQQTRDSQCGNLTTNAGASASASRSTASATASSGTAASATGAAASASATTGAAHAVAFAHEFGTPLLAGGLVALFGLAL